MVTPGERFRMLREQLGLSQMQFCKLVGVSQVSINRYEHGDSEPTFRILRWYADYFDVSLDWIFCRTDNPKGMEYGCAAPIDKYATDMEQFVSACFVPGSPLATRLQDTILTMWREQEGALPPKESEVKP